jgi:salicylate hydroxylase
MVQDASLANMAFYHLPDGPEQRERDRKLKNFSGESIVSYDWLWNGTPLDDPDNESFDYQFAK